MTAIIDPNSDSHNLDNEILFGRISDDLVNKGYSTNVNALPFKLANELFLHVSAMSDASFEEAAIGRNEEHMNNTLVRSQKQCWISDDSSASSNWLRWAGELQAYLNQHLFLGLLSFESHYALYRPGDFYKRHYDAFTGQSSRKLSIVVYLNKEWLSSEGGELVLYDADDDMVGLNIIPNFATVVAFLSAEHPHEVLRSQRNRYSIAGWYSPSSAIPARH